MKHRVSLLQRACWCLKTAEEVKEAGGPVEGFSHELADERPDQSLNWQMSAQRPGLERVGGCWQMPISAVHLPAFVHHQRNPNMGHTQWTLAVE